MSGIDIRDPVAVFRDPAATAVATKKVYSDADIVLSNDWVPPVTIVPTNITTTHSEESPGRKKTSSVSFSLDSNTEAEHAHPQAGKDDPEKHETKKNKVCTHDSLLIFYI